MPRRRIGYPHHAKTQEEVRAYVRAYTTGLVREEQERKARLLVEKQKKAEEKRAMQKNLIETIRDLLNDPQRLADAGVTPAEIANLKALRTAYERDTPLTTGEELGILADLKAVREKLNRVGAG